MSSITSRGLASGLNGLTCIAQQLGLCNGSFVKRRCARGSNLNEPAATRYPPRQPLNLWRCDNVDAAFCMLDCRRIHSRFSPTIARRASIRLPHVSLDGGRSRRVIGLGWRGIQAESSCRREEYEVSVSADGKWTFTSQEGEHRDRQECRHYGGGSAQASPSIVDA
ncbi:hypothetical protein ALC56_07625 [Trachymyrmex septentrionalis]|uniref:Uncharacterized protein n=1 Tax=Trachymyrmex septentrionalis TaxID=34720 RepID=A0A195FC82_9HYME|nr:hypothetical protein ALC56_07625 [Trachymyrmex septentrionalis]